LDEWNTYINKIMGVHSVARKPNLVKLIQTLLHNKNAKPQPPATKGQSMAKKCSVCGNLITFSRNDSQINCGNCGSITALKTMCQGECSNCKSMLQYSTGLSEVDCPKCKSKIYVVSKDP